MRINVARFLLASMAVLMLAETASACHACKATPCVYYPPQPAYQCVVEMVPYTVYKQRKRIEYQDVQETIMVKIPVTTYIERQRVICKPIWETTWYDQTVTYCKLKTETKMVDQEYTVCKPVLTPKKVTEWCFEPVTCWVTVPVYQKCGFCGLSKTYCGCQTVAQTTYKPVPVERDITVTEYVPETHTRKVPVSWCYYVQETKVVKVPVKNCRYESSVVIDKIPVTTFHCEPKVITRKIPYPVCETVAVTCYRPVKHLVPIVCAPAAEATPQAAPVMPEPQATPKQG